MKKAFFFPILIASALLWTGCGKTANNVPAIGKTIVDKLFIGPVIIGKWKVATSSTYNGKTSEPVFTTIYRFRQDKTCVLTSFNGNMEVKYQWEVKDNVVSLVLPNIRLTKSFTYYILDNDDILLIDFTGNTNHLVRMRADHDDGSNTDAK
jgi:hypothetical protein